ncbi:MAG TPA: NTP transferase domain-containing protein [Kofleriaceae bacterium]|jgi:molybdopterin-guanine dinucleotide biosynthesis protein A|nr:NTP transferase domain-containing protein [Kofleriaceae bacterium]
MQRDQLTALILAGGKATRLGGADKRELVIAGRTIFERQVRDRRRHAICAPGVLAEPLCTILRVAAWFEEDEVCAIDPDLRALHNVNTPEDRSR